MKFGMFFLMDDNRGIGDRGLLDEVTNQARLAEELGYDSVWVTEHHFDPTYGLLGSPLSYCAYLAAKTSRIRIGTAVVILPLHHPIRVAHEAALVDQLSNGRLELGLGSGYADYEFDVFQVGMEDRRDRFAEGVDIVMKTLRDGRVEYHGKYYDFRDTPIYPPAVQRPAPPLWMTAFTPGTIEAAGRRGANLVQASTAGVSRADLKAKFDLGEKAYLEAGHDPAKLEKALNCWVYVADSAAEARRATEESIMRFTRRNIHYFQHVAAIGANDVTYEWLQQNGMVSHGTPDQVARELLTLQCDTGMTYPLLRMRCGGMDPKGLERSMRLFAEEVMPALREADVPVAV